MQVTGMLYGTKLLQFAGFPTSEVLGPDASEEEVKALIERHGSVFVKPVFKGGVGKKGKAGLLGRAHDLRTALKEKERLYFVEHRHGNQLAKANGVTFEGAVPAEHEAYFSITDSTHFRAPTMTLTYHGGMDIEELDKVAALNEQIGALLPRQSMQDTSGASQMDSKNQVTSLHGMSMLEAAQRPMESNVCLALLHEPGGDNDCKLINVAIGAELNLHGDATLAAAQASREAGNAPNSVLAAAASIVGPRREEAARRALRELIERFARAGLQDARDETFDLFKVPPAPRELFVNEKADPKAEAMLDGLKMRGAQSVFVHYLRTLGGHPTADGVLAAIAATLAWGPLMRKRISKQTAESLPWWLRLFGTMIGASVDAGKHTAASFCDIPASDLLGTRSLTEVACVALIGQDPGSADLFAFQTLVGLLLTNGPGAISAQGAKGATSADGPEAPGRVQLNKALVGFLTHSGYAHGGNGYEGVAFLLERFKDVALVDPSDPNHGLDLKTMAAEFARRYGEERIQRKEMGAEAAQAPPCINHPVFKGKPVNIDPREEFIRNLFQQRAEYNAFHDYYSTLVQVLYDENVTRNFFCVNVDAVIATLLLKMLWRRYREGKFSERALETAAFTVFLYGRMLGCAAEIDDHLNRGKNMDTRTPQANIRFVA